MPLSFTFKAVLKLMLPLGPAPKQHYEVAERRKVQKTCGIPPPGPCILSLSAAQGLRQWAQGHANSIMKKRSVYEINPHHKACMMQPHFLPADNDVALLNISGCGLLSVLSRGNTVMPFCCLIVARCSISPQRKHLEKALTLIPRCTQPYYRDGQERTLFDSGTSYCDCFCFFYFSSFHSCIK